MLFELMQKTSEDQKNYSRSENFNKMLLTIMMMFEVMQNLYDMLRYLMIGADKTERFLADECEEPRRMNSFQSFPKSQKNELESQPYPFHPVQIDLESFVDAEMTSEVQFLRRKAKNVGSVEDFKKEPEDDDDGVVLFTDSNRKGSLYRCLKSPSIEYYEAKNSNSAVKEEPLEVSKPADDLKPQEEEEAEDKSREEAEVPTVSLSQDKEEVKKLEARGKETANANDASSNEYYVEVPSNMTKAVQVEDAAQLNLTEDPTAFPFDPGELVENEARFPADEFFDEISEVTDPVDLPDQELGKPRLRSVQDLI